MKYAAPLAVLLVSCADTTAPMYEPPLAAISAHTLGLREELIALRRDIHQNPELSGSESGTAARIEAKLSALGLEVRTGVGGHGVVGILRGALAGPVVAYRADMDAMPGDEPPGRDYGSRVPGVYHVCGHDLHSAIGVGVASVLSAMRERMPGTAVFLFQPAEENLQGAAAMLAEAALDAPRPEVIYAVHVFPFPVGTVARNVDFGGLDQFTIELPEATDTPEVAERVAARLSALGTVSRPGPGSVESYLEQLLAADGPLHTAVYMDVETELEGGRARLEGSLRAYTDAEYPRIRAAITGILEAELGGASYELTFRDAPFPSMQSDRNVSLEAAAALEEAVGADKLLTLAAMHPFSGEDFALYLQQIPGAMFLVGVANAERGIVGAPHSPDFDADEEAISVATKAMSLVLWERLLKSAPPGAD